MTDDAERTPLLNDSGDQSFYNTKLESASAEEAEAGVINSMAYKSSILGSWETFNLMLTHTVWRNPTLWKMMFKLGLLSMICFMLPIALVPDPGALKVSRLISISQFLNVVVGLLLGFFLTSSVKRWYACVDGFLSILDAVRNLQMQFIALGVPENAMSRILRHAFASAVLLYESLLLDSRKLYGTRPEEEEKDAFWKSIGSRPALREARMPGAKLLEEHEIDCLKMVRDPPSVIWTWSAAQIGRLAQDGFIPPMASPTYGRIMNLCQSAHGGIRRVRASICVQVPWNYAHFLASLVHINNVLNAMTAGFVLGVVTGTVLQWKKQFLRYERQPSFEEVEKDLEGLLITLLLCWVGPLVYQALLLIGISLAQPFHDEAARIPMDRLLNHLEADLNDSHELTDKMPDVFDGFKLPHFKQPEGP